MLGMILGNIMTGVSLDLHCLSTGAWQNRRGIEARLALGAKRWEARRPISRATMTNAQMPSINAMSVSRIVYLPGIMTGQIISGIDAMEAVKYQILVLFSIVGGTGFGIVVAALRLTDNRHHLRLYRLAAARD